MPQYPKPFFKPKRNTWYVEVSRVQHLLGKHPEGLPPPKKCRGHWEAPRIILDAYHAKMTKLQQSAAEEPSIVPDSLDHAPCS
jgi:hypothetical protein